MRRKAEIGALASFVIALIPSHGSFLQTKTDWQTALSTDYESDRMCRHPLQFDRLWNAHSDPAGLSRRMNQSYLLLGLSARWEQTYGIGTAVGTLATIDVATAPVITLAVRHSHDGSRNKDIVKIQWSLGLCRVDMPPAKLGGYGVVG